MTALSTVAWQFKKALYDAAVALWETNHPEVLVTWGPHTAPTVPDDLVSFTDVSSDQEPATLSATNRSREETLNLDIEFWAFRPGRVDAALEAEQALYERMGELEHYVRQTDTTLGGTVRQCFLVRHAAASAAYSRGQEQGALAGAVATFQAIVRITG